MTIVFFVNERLAFGSRVTRKTHCEKLKSLGITHVVNLRTTKARRLKEFKRIWLGFKDDGKRRPASFYRRALSFYCKAIKRPGAKVFVMCRMGRHRSASLTYFLLRASGASSSAAEAAILRARPCARIVKAYRESGEKYLDLAC
jgi:protein-tyrosine phosphatase